MRRLISVPSLLFWLMVLLVVLPPASFTQTEQRPLTENENSSNLQGRNVIARIWHGRTLASKADEYYQYLKEAGINKIVSIPGNLGAQVLRRNEGKVTEFTVISYWESRDAIRKFAGEDIEKARYLPRDPEYLLELEPNVKHFNVVLDERKR